MVLAIVVLVVLLLCFTALLVWIRTAPSAEQLWGTNDPDATARAEPTRPTGDERAAQAPARRTAPWLAGPVSAVVARYDWSRRRA